MKRRVCLYCVYPPICHAATIAPPPGNTQLMSYFQLPTATPIRRCMQATIISDRDLLQCFKASPTLAPARTTDFNPSGSWSHFYFGNCYTTMSIPSISLHLPITSIHPSLRCTAFFKQYIYFLLSTTLLEVTRSSHYNLHILPSTLE